MEGQLYFAGDHTELMHGLMDSAIKSGGKRTTHAQWRTSSASVFQSNGIRIGPMRKVLILFLPLAAQFFLLRAADSLTFHIQAINLSEDMSAVSSHNDELLLLIYAKEDSSTLSAPTFTRKKR